MRLNFPSYIFIFILLLSPLAVTGNFQKAFALTPVADLTGDWSGFAQITITGGYCQFTGNVNAHVTQNGNQISGSFSVVTTSAKSSNPDVYQCDYDAFTYSDSISGTIDGSQITLYSSDATFTGWYASSGISLSISSADYSGSTQLSPTGFTPPQFEPKDEPVQPPPEDEEEYGGYSSWDEYCKAEYGSDTYYDASTNSCEYYEQDSDGDSIDDSVDECIGLLEDFYGENESDGCPEKDSDDDTIYDYEDSCPYDPEDFLGIDDGCPEEEEDTDGDSFYDDEDVCPYDAEDYFEFGELDGCPEEDSDGDNIYDSIDKCIYDPEDAVGDTDGCPDQDDLIVDQDEFVEDEFAEDEFAEDEYAEDVIFPTRLPDNFFRTNGCGSQEAGIDFVPDFDFAESCNQHDICYARGGAAEDRKTCDEEFYDSIKSNSILGKFGAEIYYWAVRLGGTTAFNCVDDSCR